MRFVLQVLVGISILVPSLSFAQNIPATALFARCYAQLTDRPVPLTHASYVAVKNGTLDPITACMQVLEKGRLSDANYINGADIEAKAVLNRLYGFHRSWFAGTKIEDIPEHSIETGHGSNDTYDSTEPALALTYKLFKPGARYEDVLRDATGYVATRAEDQKIKAIFGAGFASSYPARWIFGNNPKFLENLINFRSPAADGLFVIDESRSVLAHMPMIQIGELVGVHPQFQSFVVPNLALRPLGDKSDGKYGILQPGLNYTYNFYQNFGGGVLGQPIYLMMNLGHPKGLEFNGADKLPRRWIQASMESFMCTQFPSLQAADVVPFLNASASVPFRKSSSCLRCHATMDRAAMVGRNIVAGGSDYLIIQAGPFLNYAKPLDLITSYRAEIGGDETWPAAPVANYHRTTPAGRLYFRSVTGQLINEGLNGIASLGNAMSRTDDFYQCAAKRYFEFFTGIQVALYDRTDPRFSQMTANMTPEARRDRVFIEELGAKLKTSQSLFELVRDILKSDYYKDLNFRPPSSGGS